MEATPAQIRDHGEAVNREFDAQLESKTSKLLDYSPQRGKSHRRCLSRRSRVSRIACSNEEALDRLLNPERNHLPPETLNVGVHAPIMRALQHATYTFAKKISHTADTQDQRHRMVPGSRPLLTLADTREPDYITPALLNENPRAKEVYDRAMHDAWTAKNQLLDRGVPAEIALYLLPNAKSIRLIETGSLFTSYTNGPCAPASTLRKKSTNASMDELAQLRQVHPEIARYVGPPCYLRANITTPVCTEGSHFCGIKVWLDFPNVQRRI